MISRTLPISQWLMPVGYFNKRIKGGEKHIRYATICCSRDKNGWFYSDNKAQILFTEEEQNICLNYLSSLGLSRDCKFITLLVRDNAYLKQFDYKNNTNFDYHHYRNADITSFKDSINYLTNKGITVFRMGKVVEKTFNDQQSTLF
ncbi:TIGR04372 family glycosyltransferase [Alphaproteobacteria bacterium]|nr:TIGR04372 family glycosyltransferase [Alphaproteobacteria bacterium]